MRGQDVPQATIERIVEVVRAVAAGATSNSEVGQAVGSSERHASYGVAAAVALGLIERAPDLGVTALGRQVANAAAGSSAEATALRQAIEKSTIVAALAPDLLDTTPPSKATLAKRLARVGLSPSTATHRAAMILKWRRRLGLSGTPAPESGSGGMWRRIELRNYRSIESVTLDLAPFTLVVGPNGSGKSNFADALVFARDVGVDASVALDNRGGLIGVRRWRPSKPTDVTIDIRAATSQVKLDSDYVRHAFTIHSGKAGDWSFSRETLENVVHGVAGFSLERAGSAVKGTFLQDAERKPSITATASAMVIAQQYRGFIRGRALRTVRRYRISPDEMRKPQLSSEKTRLEENGANIAVAVRSLKQSKDDFDELLRTMAQIVPGLIDIKPEQLGRYIALKFSQQQGKGEVADFNATEMSEGALRALGIVVASLQMRTEELLIIEEPEVSLHVGAAHLLFDVLKRASTRGSVLVTTHSADLLDAAMGELILVCDYVGGITRIGPMATQQRTVVRQGLYSLAELMRVEPLRIEGAPLREFEEEDGE